MTGNALASSDIQSQFLDTQQPILLRFTAEHIGHEHLQFNI